MDSTNTINTMEIESSEYVLDSLTVHARGE